MFQFIRGWVRNEKQRPAPEAIYWPQYSAKELAWRTDEGPHAYPLPVTCHCERSVAISAWEEKNRHSVQRDRHPPKADCAPCDDKLATREDEGLTDTHGLCKVIGLFGFRSS